MPLAAPNHVIPVRICRTLFYFFIIKFIFSFFLPNSRFLLGKVIPIMIYDNLKNPPLNFTFSLYFLDQMKFIVEDV
jgi:hypothetical protein